MKVYIPLNEKGVNELNSWQETETENLKIVVFSGDDYKYLEDRKYLDFLNVECDCLIDLYENEDIPNEKLKNALEVTELLINNSDDERYIGLLNRFKNIFSLAIDCNTYVNIYCYGEKSEG